MRRIWWAVAAAVLAVACGRGGATSRSGKPSPETYKGRSLVITDSMVMQGGADTLKLGRIHSGEILTLPLRLVNGAEKPLVPVSTSRSCGCVDLEFEAQPILPREWQDCRLIFDSRGMSGWQIKRLDLRLGNSPHVIRLWVDVEVR